MTEIRRARCGRILFVALLLALAVPASAARERARRDLQAPQTRQAEKPRELVEVRMRVEPEQPYVGQQVRLTVEVIRRVGIFDYSFDPPVLEGLLQPAPWVEANFDSFEDGISISIREYSTSVYPTRSGWVEIGSAAFRCRVKIGTLAVSESIFDDFYSGRNEPAGGKTAPLMLEAKPLPAPPTGVSGPVLVGRTEVRTTLAPETVPSGQAATLSIEVRSEGLVSRLERPVLPGLTSSFRVVEDSPVLEWIATEVGVLGRRRFTQALIPKLAGSYAIEPVRIPFFDPLAGSYGVAEGPSLTLAVTRIVASGRSSAEPVVDADAIRSVWLELPEVEVVNPRSTAGWPGLATAVAGLLALVVAWRSAVHRQRLESDPAFARSRAALGGARRMLGAAEGDFGKGRVAEGFEGVGRALAAFVGDKLDLGAGARTPEEVDRHLSEVGVDGATREKLRVLLERCERARLLHRAGSKHDVADVISAARELLEALDRSFGAASRGRA